MDVDFAFICDFAEAGRKINALGIGFDRINAPSVPARHPHFHVVAQIKFSLTEVGPKDMEVRLIDADGQDVIPPIRGQLEVPATSPGALHAQGRLNIGFGNVEFRQYGQYSVRVTIQGTELINIPFTVAQPPTTT